MYVGPTIDDDDELCGGIGGNVSPIAERNILVADVRKRQPFAIDDEEKLNLGRIAIRPLRSHD